jgi:hypothetical protein
MILKHCLGEIGGKSFGTALLAELNGLITATAQEFPLDKLASPGWCPSTESQARIEDLEFREVAGELAEGSFLVSFQEFMQRDCQDVLVEGRHSGRMTFRLHFSTGEIEFAAESHPTRDYDPEEF